MRRITIQGKPGLESKTLFGNKDKVGGNEPVLGLCPFHPLSLFLS